MKIIYEGDVSCIHMIPELVKYYEAYGEKYGWTSPSKAGVATFDVNGVEFIGMPYMVKSGLKIRVWERRKCPKQTHTLD